MEWSMITELSGSFETVGFGGAWVPFIAVGADAVGWATAGADRASNTGNAGAALGAGSSSSQDGRNAAARRSKSSGVSAALPSPAGPRAGLPG
jgi:hypothetical protein